MSQIQVPKGCTISKINELCDVVRGGSPRPKGDPRYFDGPIPWIKISDATAAQGKYITKTKEGLKEEGISKSRFLKSGTLILTNSATICLPKILKIDGCIHDGFLAFLNLKQQIDQMYLYYYFLMQREKITNEVARGMAQKNLNTSLIGNIEIFYPDIKIQKKIVQKLDYILGQLEEKKKEIATINAKNKNELNNLKKGLLLSLIKKLIPMSDLPHGWKYEKLADISKIERGQFRHRPRNDPEYYGGKYPFIQTGDITRSEGHVKDYRQTLNEKGFKVSKMFKKGTVMITIAANIGDTAILEFDSCFPDSIIGITPFEGKSLPEYIEYVLRMYRNELNITASKGAQKNINYGFLQPLKIPIPPTLAMQKEIVQQIQNSELEMQKTISKLESIINDAEKKINYLNTLSSSILNTAFSGKLVN